PDRHFGGREAVLSPAKSCTGGPSPLAKNRVFSYVCVIPPSAGGCSRVPAPSVRTGRSIGSPGTFFQTPALPKDLRSLTLNPPCAPLPFCEAPGSLHTGQLPPMREMKLQDLKSKTPAELVAFAEQNNVENASTMRKQELMFAILKQLATQEIDIIGEGVVEVLSDGFGFLRSPESNYLSGPDDIYVSPSQIRRFGLRTGDTVDGHIRSPKEGERYFAL